MLVWSFPWRRESNGGHYFSIRYLTNRKISGIHRKITIQRVQQLVFLSNSR